MSWTEERVALLKQHWGSGKSANEIADLLGNVTRNAVIGKAHRLGLSNSRTPAPPTSRPIAGNPESVATILSLTDRMCRWPHGDPKQPGFRFCAKSVIGNLPYCSEHARQAYQVPNGKRRDDDQADVA